MSSLPHLGLGRISADTVAWSAISGSVTVVQSLSCMPSSRVECALERSALPILRRATTGLLHRQCLSHHTPSQRFQNPTHRCPFSSTSLPLSERESRSRLINSRNPSSTSTSSIPEVEVDERNSTTHALSDAGDAASSSSTRTHITLFQRFGEVTRIFVQPNGRRADVVSADIHFVKRTLHAYAEKPFRVQEREIILFPTRTEQGRDDGATFMSNFPPTMTQEELSEAERKYEQFVMRPGSKYAYFIYSNDDHVGEILSVHQRVSITVRRRTLRIERAENRPYSPSPGSLADALELGKPLDPATCSAILRELTRTVSRVRGSHNPSRVLWIGWLPARISRTALTNFWSRLGSVVDIRSSLKNGYAHVELPSTEEALRAVYQGVPHGFRCRQRLLDIDFAPWVFYVGRAYRVVYISGWPGFDGRPALLQWTYDIPDITEATVSPPFLGGKRSDPHSAFLRFRTIDDARGASHAEWTGGTRWRVRLSRPPVVGYVRWRIW
ncbi:hypothetical protein F5888DRAFT_911356 [Russula emetica]|nr:hypothetical protein F5888DRAFT_911356 [Russula emetica]